MSFLGQMRSFEVTKRIPIARFGFEGALIVASILVAFAIDSWWQNHQERDEEQQFLASLMDEFELNKAEMARAKGSLEESQRAALQMLSLAGKELSKDESDSASQNMEKILTYWTFDPSSGALDSLIGSGQLDLIRNRELRKRLAGWSGRVRDLKEEESVVDYIAIRELEPRQRGVVGAYPPLEQAAPGRFRPKWDEVLGDLEFLNTIALTYIWMDSTIDDALVVEKEIDEILVLVKGELAQ